MVLVSGGGDGGDGEAEIHLYGVIEREEISIPLATATNSPNLCRLALRLSLKEALLARSAYLEAAVKLPAFGNLVSAPLENVKTRVAPSHFFFSSCNSQLFLRAESTPEPILFATFFLSHIPGDT